ncbi:DMT family transporter [Nocardioides sambongensis]|uniref:DMT family transporter n=1 Tax=Nocardioides sambongensis TaxID=2589074 RepID=UPI001E5900AD|nr:DMT family transporter [Nocardioides sambongensis]
MNSVESGPGEHRSVLPLLAVGTTLLLWSSAFVGIRHLADDFSPGALSLGRLLVGSVALGVVALPRGLPRPSRRQWVSIVAIGVLWFGIYNLALNAGEQRVDAGTAAMLIQVSPVLIAVLAATFLSERFTPTLLAGLALAFAGVAVIGMSTSGDGSRDLLGVGLCLLAALVYSISLVVQKPLVASLSAIHVTWLACSVGAVVCLPWLGELVGQVREAPASSTWWLVYLGIFPTAVAFTTYAYALRHMDASSLGVTTYLVPPLTIVMGLVLLDEVPPTIAYVGGTLALVGVAVARRRPSSRRPGQGASPDVEEPAPAPS